MHEVKAVNNHLAITIDGTKIEYDSYFGAGHQSGFCLSRGGSYEVQFKSLPVVWKKLRKKEREAFAPFKSLFEQFGENA